MKFGIFSVHDAKAAAFLPPFFLPNDAMATRAFSDAAMDTNHLFNKHPSDYSLHRVGDFDDATGEVTNISPSIHLGNASSFCFPLE